MPQQKIHFGNQSGLTIPLQPGDQELFPQQLMTAVDDCSNPSAYPVLFSGVFEAISAIAAGRKPLKAPCRRRPIKRCVVFVEKPTIIWASASPNTALRVIIFLPYLSPRLPHTGARKNERKNGPAKTRPLHLAVSLNSVTPSSLTNNGKKGTIALIPTMARNWQIHIMYKFFFHKLIIKNYTILRMLKKKEND